MNLDTYVQFQIDYDEFIEAHSQKHPDEAHAYWQEFEAHYKEYIEKSEKLLELLV